MISEERKREIEAEERARAAEEAYRQEIRSKFSGPQSLPEVPQRPVANAEAETKGGIRLWQVGLVIALAVAITYAFMGQGGTPSKSKAPASTAAAAPAPRPVYVPVNQNLASGQITVQPGRVVKYKIRIRPEMKSAVLKGTFNASGGSGNDVAAVVTTETEFENWINGHTARVLYSSNGRKTTDSFEVSLPEGDYIFAVSNSFSVFSAKTVFLQADLAFKVLQQPRWNPFADIPD